LYRVDGSVQAVQTCTQVMWSVVSVAQKCCFADVAKNLRNLLQQLCLGSVPLVVRLHLEKCVAGLVLLLGFLHFHFQEDGEVVHDRYGLW